MEENFPTPDSAASQKQQNDAGSSDHFSNSDENKKVRFAPVLEVGEKEEPVIHRSPKARRNAISSLDELNEVVSFLTAPHRRPHMISFSLNFLFQILCHFWIILVRGLGKSESQHRVVPGGGAAALHWFGFWWVGSAPHFTQRCQENDGGQTICKIIRRRTRGVANP